MLISLFMVGGTSWGCLVSLIELLSSFSLLPGSSICKITGLRGGFVDFSLAIMTGKLRYCSYVSSANSCHSVLFLVIKSSVGFLKFVITWHR